MIKSVFKAIIYQPLYNTLVLLVAVIPGGDLGVAVIALTCVVKLVLFPFSKKATESQMKMKAIQPEIDSLKEKLKNNKQEQAVRIMALYKEKGVNPFSGIGLILIQLPIIMALYYIILRGGFPSINTDLLYSFIPIPSSVSMHFLGIFDISARSFWMAVLVGITQFLQIRLTMPVVPKKVQNAGFKEDFARSMSLQMKYGMPIFVAFVTYSLPAVVGLYWITSNLFAVGQEIFIRKKFPAISVVKENLAK